MGEPGPAVCRVWVLSVWGQTLVEQPVSGPALRLARVARTWETAADWPATHAPVVVVLAQVCRALDIDPVVVAWILGAKAATWYCRWQQEQPKRDEA